MFGTWKGLTPNPYYAFNCNYPFKPGNIKISYLWFFLYAFKMATANINFNRDYTRYS